MSKTGTKRRKTGKAVRARSGAAPTSAAQSLLSAGATPEGALSAFPRVALIGCGLIGQKRLNNLPPGAVVAACDLNLERAKHLAAQSPGCRATNSVSEALAAPGVDVAMI